MKDIKKSKEYLELALEKLGDIPYTEKATQLKIHINTLSQYRRGVNTMDDFACIMVARTLGIDPLIVITAANLEREKKPERIEEWEDLKKKLGVLSIAGMMALTLVNPSPAKAENLAHNSQVNFYILCQISK